jgi:hypothetical protein
MSIRRDRVKLTLSALQDDPDGAGNLELFADALEFWNHTSIPLQRLEAFKGRDDVNRAGFVGGSKP